MGSLPNDNDSEIRIAILSELAQNILHFERFWEKLENQRAQTLDQSMEQAFIEARIPSWAQIGFTKYIDSLNQVFTSNQVQAIHKIYSRLNNIANLQVETQQAKEQLPKFTGKREELARSGVYNSSLEPFWDAEIARLRQKSGEAWIDFFTARNIIQTEWNLLKTQWNG